MSGDTGTSRSIETVRPKSLPKSNAPLGVDAAEDAFADGGVTSGFAVEVPRRSGGASGLMPSAVGVPLRSSSSVATDPIVALLLPPLAVVGVEPRDDASDPLGDVDALLPPDAGNEASRDSFR